MSPLRVRLAGVYDVELARRVAFLTVPAQMFPEASVDDVEARLARDWSASAVRSYVLEQKLHLADVAGAPVGVALTKADGATQFLVTADAPRGTRGELLSSVRDVTMPALLADPPSTATSWRDADVVVAAADGSSLKNPGPAGWAWYIDDDTWAAGGWPHGTNNMGELMAVLDLLRQTRGMRGQLRILCDSQYAIKCCTEWLSGWKRRGWRKADGKPVLNVDLVQQLDQELTGRKVEFEWVKGHAGHELNEAADVRARAAATAYQGGVDPDCGPGFPHAEAEKPRRVRAATPPLTLEQPDLFSGV